MVCTMERKRDLIPSEEVGEGVDAWIVRERNERKGNHRRSVQIAAKSKNVVHLDCTGDTRATQQTDQLSELVNDRSARRARPLGEADEKPLACLRILQ